MSYFATREHHGNSSVLEPLVRYSFGAAFYPQKMTAGFSGTVHAHEYYTKRLYALACYA